MRKNYAFLVVAVVAFAMAAGCSSFKGFCDRGSIFPTRQMQLVPTQSMYSVTGDACCPVETMMPCCDPCGTGVSGTIFPGPAASY